MITDLNHDYVKKKKKNIYINIVKPAHAVTCIKKSCFSCPVMENFI